MKATSYTLKEPRKCISFDNTLVLQTKIKGKEMFVAAFQAFHRMTRSVLILTCRLIVLAAK